jgi:hypothetical protein
MRRTGGQGWTPRACAEQGLRSAMRRMRRTGGQGWTPRACAEQGLRSAMRRMRRTGIPQVCPGPTLSRHRLRRRRPKQRRGRRDAARGHTHARLQIFICPPGGGTSLPATRRDVAFCRHRAGDGIGPPPRGGTLRLPAKRRFTFNRQHPACPRARLRKRAGPYNSSPRARTPARLRRGSRLANFQHTRRATAPCAV